MAATNTQTAMSAPPDVPVETAEAAAKDTASRRQQKAANKLQKRLVDAFTSSIEGVEKQLQASLVQGDAAAKELAKGRRAALKKVVKVASDPSMGTLEERMQVLQASFVDMLQEQLKQDRQLSDMQTQLDSSRKEVEAGKAEFARSQQKVDSLQKLARSLTADNKTLSEDASRQRQHTDKVQELLKGIQERIAEQQLETVKVLEHNKLLTQENGLIKAQLGSTQELLDQLRTTQQDRIAGLAEQLQQQNAALSQAGELQAVMGNLMKEKEVLTLKAALADTYKERNTVLEKAFAEAQAQAVVHRQQMAEMQDSMKKASKVLQSFEKMQKGMTEQQQVTTQLMKERQLLQQQVQLLQQQSRDQADKLRRAQLQKQRLEGLCRTLQARAGAAHGWAGDSFIGAAADAADGDDGPGEAMPEGPAAAAPGSHTVAAVGTAGSADDGAACGAAADGASGGHAAGSTARVDTDSTQAAAAPASAATAAGEATAGAEPDVCNGETHPAAGVPVLPHMS